MRRYRITNWSQYNASLVQRGSLTIWFSEDAVKNWRSKEKGKNGRPQIYSNEAILAALVIRSVYHLPLRALTGFLRSIIAMLGLNLPIPSYSQISRRAKNLKKSLGKLSRRLPTDLVFDSTGLKVYGEGEWKVRQHGASKRRTWRKFHIGLDPKSSEVVVMELTDNGKADANVAREMLEKTPKSIERIYGDKAYDRFKFRRLVHSRGAESIIPPCRNGKVHRKTMDGGIEERNKAIMQIVGLGGDELARKLWKKLKGYHKRSLVETTMYRLKQLTGDRLRSRGWDQQCVEAHVRCLILNRMANLGMPTGFWEEAA